MTRSRNRRTFGVRQHDGGEGGAPVGDPDGEIALPELVHADRLPPGGIGAAGRGEDREAQQREQQRGRGSSHG